MTDALAAQQLFGPGRWLVTTETSTYVLELGDTGTGSLVRHVGEGGGAALEAAELPPPIAVNLRGDGERIPVVWAVGPVVGEPWVLLLDVRRDGVPTLRRTNIVRHVARDPVA